jgi:hypothetical protein
MQFTYVIFMASSACRNYMSSNEIYRAILDENGNTVHGDKQEYEVALNMRAHIELLRTYDYTLYSRISDYCALAEYLGFGHSDILRRVDNMKNEYNFIKANEGQRNITP